MSWTTPGDASSAPLSFTTSSYEPVVPPRSTVFAVIVIVGNPTAGHARASWETWTAVIVTSTLAFWIAGGLLGIFVGPTQAASRSLMARLAPPELRTEMFGLYALSGKITATVDGTAPPVRPPGVDPDVGARLDDDDPSAIEATLGRRDDFNRADWFIVSIDAYLDRRTAYAFAVNAAGVQFDAVQSDAGDDFGGGPGLPGMDESWDAIWAAAVRTTPEGWVAEIEIPYSMLRFPRAGSQTWGIQFSRHVPRLGEEAEWPLVPRAQRARPPRAAASSTALSATRASPSPCTGRSAARSSRRSAPVSWAWPTPGRP